MCTLRSKNGGLLGGRDKSSLPRLSRRLRSRGTFRPDCDVSPARQNRPAVPADPGDRRHQCTRLLRHGALGCVTSVPYSFATANVGRELRAALARKRTLEDARFELCSYRDYPHLLQHVVLMEPGP